MRYACVVCWVVLISTTACNYGWNKANGVQVVPTAYFYPPGIETSATDPRPIPSNTVKHLPSRRVSVVLPDGWHWSMRGRDLIATRDGVFLQHILIEQIHVDEVEQSIFGSWPFIGGRSQNAGVFVRSTKQWPLRTVKYFTKRLEAGMAPTDAAEVILGSRANDPSVADLVVREVGGRSFAGNQGFKVVVDFRVPPPRRSVSDGRRSGAGRR